MTWTEYCKTPKGDELNRRFRQFQLDAIAKDGSWWAVNALQYLAIMELWKFLADDDEFFVPDEAANETPENLFGRFLKWAKHHYDIAVVLTLDHGDERFKVIKDAFSESWKKLVC